jgi:hypothetical protein
MPNYQHRAADAKRKTDHFQQLEAVSWLLAELGDPGKKHVKRGFKMTN